MKRGLVFLLIVSIFLLGCSNKPSELPSESVFFGGSQGVVAAFEPFGVRDNGVFTIFDTDTFPLEISLRNKGEVDVEPGDVTVSIKGINLGDFNNVPSASKFNTGVLEKVSEFNREGGDELIDFTSGSEGALYKGQVIGFYEPDIFAQVEYKYQTNVVIPKVCFKEDPTDDSICELKESKNFFVSGAPVTVTKVQEDVAGRGRIFLTFEIKNVGGGRVTKSGEPFDTRFGQLRFVIDNSDLWSCRGGGKEGEARLIDGVAVVNCRLKEPLPVGTLDTRQIAATLDYEYRTIIDETIRIKESLK